MFIPLGRKKGGEEGGECGIFPGLPELIYLGVFALRHLKCFLKSLLNCCITFGNKTCNREKWLYKVETSTGEYQQYLEQKFAFSFFIFI